jgi:DNA polymerase III delta subunit
MSVKAFFSELAKGLTQPAYLLYAEDAYLLTEALLEVKRTVPEAEQDFLFHPFDILSPEGAPPLEQIIDVLYTVPFFAGGRKVVAIEGVQKIPVAGLKTLAGYIGKPSPDSVLLLLYAGSLKKTTRDKLEGAKLISLDIRERDIPFWLKEKAGKKGFTLSKDAVDYLLGTIGPDAGLLSSEIEKLAMLGKKNLTADDIAGMVRGMGDYDVFDLIRALKAGDANRVFSIYSVLSTLQEPYAMLGALNWHYGKGGVNGQKEVFALLNEADLMLKSAGKAYPMEYLLKRLLEL